MFFEVQGSRNSSECDGLSRRDFVRAGALGLGAGSLLFSDLLRARAAAANQGHSTRKTSVVWLWLSGGPTHVETFDPKMSAPEEYRSTTGAVKTNVPGIEIGGTYPKIAQHADKFAFIRSFAHSNSGHGGGTHWLMTGYNFRAADNGARQNKPSLGSIVARHRGANNSETGLPTYVRLNGIGNDGPAWLGPAYAPFDTNGEARRNMNLRLTQEHVQDRRKLLNEFDTLNRKVDQSGLVEGLDSFEQQAFDLILSRARETFDVTREDPRTVDRYGNGRGLGQQLLLARRLVENGVGFVTVNYGGWDMHGKIKNSIEKRAPQMDQAVAAFVADIKERGLDQDVLLIISGEFGRTPRINKNAGRDHWAPLSTLALAGGGLKMGQTVGESTAKVERPKSKTITPQDLMSTIFHVLDVPQDVHFKDNTGRPVPMLRGGTPIAELV